MDNNKILITVLAASDNSDTTIEILKSGKIICIAFAILFLILAVVFFFVFKIPETFSAVTGRTKKRAIEEMTARNANTGRLLQNPKAPGGIGTSQSLSKKLNNIDTNTQIALNQQQTPFEPQISAPAYQQQSLQAPPQNVYQSEGQGNRANSNVGTRENIGSDETTLLKSTREQKITRQQTPKANQTDQNIQNVKKDIPAENKTQTNENERKQHTQSGNNSVVGESSDPVNFDIGMGLTSQLTPDMIISGEEEKNRDSGRFIILYERTLIHTDEVIDS